MSKRIITIQNRLTSVTLATLPSLLFSLPLPHAVHGKFPLDAFTLTDEKHQELEQWNWNSTVSRNEWMQENDHPYFEGLTRETLNGKKYLMMKSAYGV